MNTYTRTLCASTRSTDTKSQQRDRATNHQSQGNIGEMISVESACQSISIFIIELD